MQGYEGTVDAVVATGAGCRGMGRALRFRDGNTMTLTYQLRDDLTAHLGDEGAWVNQRLVITARGVALDSTGRITWFRVFVWGKDRDDPALANRWSDARAAWEQHRRESPLLNG
jgi:hypothetical protein